MPIDPTKFVPEDSRWADIFAHLKSKGVNVKSPTRNLGIIDKPTVIIFFDGVVAHGGAYGGYGVSTDDYRYALDICVPESKYSTLDPFVVQIREFMKELYPMFVDERNVSSSFYDDSMKAHYVECTYINHRKYNNY